MFGYAQAIIDRAVFFAREQPRGGAQLRRIDHRNGSQRFRAIALLRNKRRPILIFIPVASFLDKGFVCEPFGYDYMCHCCEHCYIGSGAQRQMIIGLDMRRTDNVYAARVDDDQLGTCAQSPLHPAGENGVAIGWVRSDD